MQIINLTPETIADYGVCGYKDAKKHKELQKKIDWFSEYYPKGLRIKAVLSQEGEYQGMLEYIPGEYAHRPVNADGYLFIHCIFVGFRKEHKGKGYASALIDTCMNEAKKQGMKGVAVVTRKGSFMVHNTLFLKKGFEMADKAKPDFDLLVYKFDKNAPDPSFKTDMLKQTDKYDKGITVIRSPQCPYTEKNVNAILQSAENKYKLQTTLIDLTDAQAAQQTPCAFGTFCFLYEGKIISYHPISQKRFENIMDKILSA